MYKSEFTIVNIQTLWLLQHACLMSGRSYNRFDIHSFQSTEYKISTCLFSAKHAALGAIQSLVGPRVRIMHLSWVGLGWFMVFNATFNNISVISWWSVLLVEETEVPRENHGPVPSHWQTLSHNVVLSTTRHKRGSNSQLQWW
jgi:hypothetical protein